MKRQYLEDDPDRDPNLPDKLKEEISEIFYWALCGLKRLVTHGRFTQCAETMELLQEYRRLNNPVLCYVEEECELGDELSVSQKDLFSDYKTYCSQNGYSPLNKVNFFRELFIAIANLRRCRPRTNNPMRLEQIMGIKIKGIMND